MFASHGKRLTKVVLSIAAGVAVCRLAAGCRTRHAGHPGLRPGRVFHEAARDPGLPEFTYRWDEHRWQFANAQHRDLFKADPVSYAPQFANFCAVALSRGEVREANPEYWLISDGKLYLFGKSIGPGLFRKDLKSLRDRAERNRALLPER